MINGKSPMGGGPAGGFFFSFLTFSCSGKTVPLPTVAARRLRFFFSFRDLLATVPLSSTLFSPFSQREVAIFLFFIGAGLQDRNRLPPLPLPSSSA